jgi:cysteine-rich repeat protein
MIRPLSLKVAFAAVLLASQALAHGNVNVNVDSYFVYSDRITEVEVDGGVYQFPDPFAAPDITEPDLALETGLAELGYPAGTSATVQEIPAIGSDETVERVVTSSHNPIDDPTVVIGDPDDYSTWIAISDVDVQVDVELTTTYYTFHRLVAALAPPCGDGIVQDGEDCDDGNTSDGDCCSATCQYETLGSACEDGRVCTNDDQCDGAGACVAGGPATTCDESWQKGVLLVKETQPGKEKFLAKFIRGPAVSQTQLGTPLAPGGTAYSICVYDESGDVVGEMRVDQAGADCSGRPCWKSLGKTPPDGKGYLYKDKSTTAADGIKIMKLKGGDAGKSLLLIKGQNDSKKDQTALPAGMAEGLSGSASATVQLFGDDVGQCFSITFDDIKKDTGDLYRGKK